MFTDFGEQTVSGTLYVSHQVLEILTNFRRKRVLGLLQGMRSKVRGAPMG